MFLECPKEASPFCIPDLSIYEKFVPTFIGAHCHAAACISMELHNADTGELICRNTPVFGTGDEIFNEKDYLAIPPCIFGSEEGLLLPPNLSLDTNLISIKKANSTYHHTGNMAYWLVAGSFK